MSDVETIPDEIRGVLVPLQETQLLMPNAAVAEVIDYCQPDLVPKSPSWILGSTSWRQRNLLIVQLETLLGYEVNSTGKHQRIIVCHTLNESAKRPFVGIVASAMPRLMRVKEENIQPEPLADLESSPLYARVMIADQEALIPDVSSLEKLLSEAV